MRTVIFSMLLGAFLASSVGCIVPIYSADPQRRSEQLINESEGLRQIQKEYERFWFLDQPSHMTPDRTDGAII